jgi:hypothetical protein
VLRQNVVAEQHIERFSEEADTFWRFAFIEVSNGLPGCGTDIALSSPLMHIVANDASR